MFFYIIIAHNRSELPLPLTQMVFDGRQRVGLNQDSRLIDVLNFSKDRTKVIQAMRAVLSLNDVVKIDDLIDTLLSSESDEIRRSTVEALLHFRTNVGKKVEFISDDSNDGMNVSANPHYSMIQMFDVSKNSQLRILDVGAGNGTLLRCLADYWSSDVRVTYKAVERNAKMRKALYDLGDRVKIKFPNVRLMQTTERGKDFFDYVNVTSDYREPFDIVNAQLFLHYCSPKQWGIFFERLRKLLTDDGKVYISVQVDSDETKRDRVVWGYKKDQFVEISTACNVTISFMRAVIQAYGWELFYDESLCYCPLHTGLQTSIVCVQVILRKGSFVESRAKTMNEYLQKMEERLIKQGEIKIIDEVSLKMIDVLNGIGVLE